MADKPKEIHYLPGYAGSQAMTIVIQLNVFPWQIRQISPIIVQTKEFLLWKRTPWDDMQSELWAVWACSLQFSHTIDTMLKPWRSSHFSTDVVCTSGARWKDRALSCHFSFVTETEKSPSRRAFTTGPCFLPPCKGAWSSQELKDSRDAAKAIDFLSASSPHRNGTSRANSLTKSGSWEYKHPRGLLLTSFSPTHDLRLLNLKGCFRLIHFP